MTLSELQVKAQEILAIFDITEFQAAQIALQMEANEALICKEGGSFIESIDGSLCNIELHMQSISESLGDASEFVRLCAFEAVQENKLSSDPQGRHPLLEMLQREHKA